MSESKEATRTLYGITETTVVMLPPGISVLEPTSKPVSVAYGPQPAPNLSSITNWLRQARLRAAAGFLIAFLLLFLGWRLIGSSTPNLWPLNAGVIVVLIVGLGVLSGRWSLSASTLTGIEFVIFGVMCIYIAIREFHGLVYEQHDSANLLATVRGSLIVAILLMFAYAMLIPNHWRSAARVVVGIGAIPPFVIGIVAITHPDVFQSLQRSTSEALITENILFIIISVCLSIYGVYVLNSLRTEVFEAKELNQYRLIRLIGSGGMGDVYLAEHCMMKRPCALKLIRTDRADDQRSLARFSQEVEATTRLSHPNTIEIYDYGRTEGGRFYYVMEFLPGLSLQDLVEEYGPLPPGRIIFLLRQACGALAEAHATGLIHRDLKPANIFAAQRGGRFDVAKLLDFGLVKDTSENYNSREPITRENTVQGTPLYMAPEQAMGKPNIDSRIDLYAMGGIAYTLLTGRPPFDRPSRIGVMAANARDAVVPPSTHNSKTPQDLEQVILKCLAKDPDERYPNAESLEQALAACSAASEWSFHQALNWWQEHESSGGQKKSEVTVTTP